MKTFFLSLLLAASHSIAFAQGGVQTIPLNGAKAFHLSADMSGVVINIGGNDEIKVHHFLTVDGKDRPDLRELNIDRSGSTLSLEELKPNNQTLEKERGYGNLNVRHRPGPYKGEQHGGTQVVSYLEVTVPADVTLTAESLYGSIDVKGVKDMPRAKSRYGSITIVFAPDAKIASIDYESDYQSIDLTLPGSITANVDLDTKYGSLYTDFDISIKANTSNGRRRPEPFSDGQLRGTINGGGERISLHSEYKNIYLRKMK
ncbi:hypothetical protein [Neolewinella agarilytica]|uniref:hypothetical protein n=1 Tax=Neolewinella agarilytica TaxID=478744 RepID=UPI0023551B76|nr:hypothetical protein [Neolewinella agarilytica]